MYYINIEINPTPLMQNAMRYPLFYLLPLLMFLAACSKGEEEKKLYPTKVVIGDTKHEFH
ncbi:hypothetical protein GCM10027293_26030 [Pontibacter aydingkolensis]